MTHPLTSSLLPPAGGSSRAPTLTLAPRLGSTLADTSTGSTTTCPTSTKISARPGTSGREAGASLPSRRPSHVSTWSEAPMGETGDGGTANNTCIFIFSASFFFFVTSSLRDFKKKTKPTTSKRLLPGSTSVSSRAQEPSEVTVSGPVRPNGTSSQLLLFLNSPPPGLSQTLMWSSSDRHSTSHSSACRRRPQRNPGCWLWVEPQSRFPVPIGRSRDHVVSPLSRRICGRSVTSEWSQSNSLHCGAGSEFSAAPHLVCVPPNYQTTKLLPAAATGDFHNTQDKSKKWPRHWVVPVHIESSFIEIKILAWKWTLSPCLHVSWSNKQTNKIFSSWRLWIPPESNLQTTQVSFHSGEEMEPLNEVAVGVTTESEPPFVTSRWTDFQSCMR